MFDFNNADAQRTGELIPDGAVCPLHLTLRPGGAGEGGWLKRNRDGTCLMLDCEFTVVEGDHAKRKLWSLFTVDGETEGQQKAVAITMSRLRAMLESARGINPADADEKAIAGRKITGYQDLDGLRFWAVIGIEKGKDGYKDKNNIKAVITPDRRDWSKLDQGRGAAPAPAASRPAGQPAAAATRSGGGRPDWANGNGRAAPVAAARPELNDDIPF